MPAQAPDVGTGTTVSFGTSSYPCNIRGVTLSGWSRAAVDVTHLGSTTARAFKLGDLYDGGTVELEILFSPNDPPPMGAAAETVTITCPIPSGGSTGATYAGSMGAIDASIAIPLEDVMTQTLRLKVLGAITPLAESKQTDGESSTKKTLVWIVLGLGALFLFTRKAKA